MTKVFVYSRAMVLKLAFYKPKNENDLAIISITDPNKYIIKFDNLPEENVLNLSFYDVTEGETPYKAMSNEDAQDVACFVKDCWGTVENLIVHCEAGISRSAGVAAAILKYFTGNDDAIFKSTIYVPNMDCYRKVLNALVYCESCGQNVADYPSRYCAGCNAYSEHEG